MIVDFPNVKKKLDKVAFAHLKFVRTRERSFLNKIENHVIHEGRGQWSYQTVDNENIEQTAQLFDSGFEVSFGDIKDLKISDVLQFFEKMATELAEKEAKFAIEKINETVIGTGNTVEMKEKSFAIASLEALSVMQVDFEDSRDKPNLPSMLVHPETAKKLIKEEQEMSSEEKRNHAQRQEEILDRKYEEYVLRESNRKLVD